MLAPGELLVKPPDEPSAKPPADRAGDPVRPSAPTAGAGEDEPESFLLILLRALGAVHT
jgi:hypothetical protein